MSDLRKFMGMGTLVNPGNPVPQYMTSIPGAEAIPLRHAAIEETRAKSHALVANMVQGANKTIEKVQLEYKNKPVYMPCTAALKLYVDEKENVACAAEVYDSRNNLVERFLPDLESQIKEDAEAQVMAKAVGFVKRLEALNSGGRVVREDAYEAIEDLYDEDIEIEDETPNERGTFFGMFFKLRPFRSEWANQVVQFTALVVFYVACSLFGTALGIGMVRIVNGG